MKMQKKILKKSVLDDPTSGDREGVHWLGQFPNFVHYFLNSRLSLVSSLLVFETLIGRLKCCIKYFPLLEEELATGRNWPSLNEGSWCALLGLPILLSSSSAHLLLCAASSAPPLIPQSWVGAVSGCTLLEGWWTCPFSIARSAYSPIQIDGHVIPSRSWWCFCCIFIIKLPNNG